MEAAQENVSSGFENHGLSVAPGSQLVEASVAVNPPTPRSEFGTDLMVSSFENKRQSCTNGQRLQESFRHPSTGCDPRVQVPTSSPGVSNCYVFKSRLQEYAQKVGLATPVYETIKEGPSHEPSFRSTVIVGGARYDSLPGFFNRKAAEQSAAEIALTELSKCGDKKESISVPVHETGLCKNLLQEYAQKMNYAIPTYLCRKDDTPGRTSLFSCTVEIGGIQYIGAAARTKKEAEIKAARTALLAIQSSGTVGGDTVGGKPQYTVIPGKRKVPETTPPQAETVKAKKPKKPRFKKKPLKKMNPVDPNDQMQAGNTGVLVNNDVGALPVAVQQFQNGLSEVHVPDYGQTPENTASSAQDNGASIIKQPNGETAAVEGGSGPRVSMNLDSNQLTASNRQQDEDGNTGSSDSSVPVTDANSDNRVGNVTPMMKPPTSDQLDASNQDSGIGQGDPTPAAGDTNHAGEEKNCQGVDHITPVTNAPPS